MSNIRNELSLLRDKRRWLKMQSTCSMFFGLLINIFSKEYFKTRPILPVVRFTVRDVIIDFQNNDGSRK